MNDKTASPRESVFGSLCTTQFKKRVLRFKWTINEFSFYRCARNSKIASSIFSDGTDDGFKWRLAMGLWLNNSYGHRVAFTCDLNLDLVSSNINYINTQCTFGILNANSKEVNKTVHGYTFGKDDSCQRSLCIKDFIRENNLFNKAGELLPNDALTIFCEIDLGVCNENFQGSRTIPALNILGLALLENPEFNDITLCAGGKEIQAHKAILAARSNVFRAMFKDDTKESQTTIVNIPDVDYEIFEKLLRFIYLDQFPDLHTVTDVMYLWSVADKYELDRLKLRCEEELGRNLSDRNAVECYIAADKVNAEHLKASTKLYIIANVTRVAKTPAFELLVHAHPDLVVEALPWIIKKSSQSLEPTISNMDETVPRLHDDLFFESLCSTFIKKSKYKLTLTIPSFSTYRVNGVNGEGFWSSRFSDETDDGLKWRLEINPFKNYLVLKLCLVSSNVSSLNTKCKFSILNYKLKEVNEKNFDYQFETNKTLEIFDFIGKNVLFNDQDGFLPDDRLTILCEIIAAVSNENISRELTIPACHVANNLGLTLFENPEFSDITLYVGGRQIQAHRAVLSVRSNVFRTMFQQDMKEGRTNRIDIQDVDYDILKRMLYFVYTGEFSDIQNVADLMHLLLAADKYELYSLRRRCEEISTINLTDKNAVEYYITADQVDMDNFKLLIKSFIIANFADVAKTSKFALLVQTHPDLVIEASL